MTPSAISEIDLRKLKRMIKPAGFYNQKARYLRSLARYIVVAHDGDVDKMGRIPTSRLRKDLLELEGIGPETADSILLYALGRPSFVVDAYTRRLLGRLGLEVGSGYDEVKRAFEKSLGGDVRKYSEMHALIVIHCKERCRKRPECDGCPLSSACSSYGKQQKEEIADKRR